MNLHSIKIWEIAAGVTLVAGAAATTFFILRRERPTPEQIEAERRLFLTQLGRIVDGTMLEVAEVPASEPGQTLTMLIYAYKIGGVDYECSQDITQLGHVVEVSQVRAGFPCSVRYQPGNPQNSIVVAEKWCGLRVTLPVFRSFERPGRLDRTT